MLATKLGELDAWLASADDGQPWCVTGSDDGISVNIYASNEGIHGVEIADWTGIVAGFGLVPYRKER